MILHDELKRFSSIVWNTGDFWGKIIIFLVVGFPLLVALVRAAGGSIALAASLAFMPFLALVILMCIAPVITVAAAKMKWSGNIFKWAIAVVGFDLVIGGSFAAMPLANDRELVPLLLVVIAAIVTLKISKVKTFFMSLLWIALLALVIIFVMGGRAKMSSARATAPPQKTSYSQAYVENGLVIKRECTAENIVQKRETPTYIKAVPGLPIINMVTDCRNDDTITRLRPWEEADVRHQDFGPLREKENRCSFNYCGDSVRVGGEIGEITRSRFVNDLAFPQFPFGVMVFYIIDDEGKLVDSEYVPRPGGIAHLANRSGKQATLFSRYNIMKTYFEDKNHKVQFGWDGSTIAHEIVRGNQNPPTQ